MIWIRKVTWCVITMGILNSCKKDSTQSLTPPAVAKCFIKGETTSLVGNEKIFDYQFDDKGNPAEVNVYNRNGGLMSTYQIGSNIITHNSIPDNLGRVHKTITEYQISDIFNGFPVRAFVSVDDGVTMWVHRWTYFFFYDAKGRLIKIGEQTDNILGDREYDLNIYYNEADNVTALQYEWTTGPRATITPITVTAYDNKPTPYASVKGWPLLNVNFAWDNYDPEPIITALSKNNPLDYTFGSGTNLIKRTMAYTYNDEGLPTQRTNTNKNENGEYTFLQTFSYNCK